MKNKQFIIVTTITLLISFLLIKNYLNMDHNKSKHIKITNYKYCESLNNKVYNNDNSSDKFD